MSFEKELNRAFAQLKTIIAEDNSNELLTLAYAEFSLKCYVGYAKRIYGSILHENAPLTRAFLSIGVDTPRDQLLILLGTFYLYLHTGANQPS